MRYPLIGVISELRGRSSRQFEELLVSQVDVALAAVALAQQAVRGELTGDEARRSGTEIEHRGDEIRLELVLILANALVTPIDREDLYRLSRLIDDILDNLRDFLREWALYEPEGPNRLEPVLDAVAEALVALRAAVTIVATSPGSITQRALVAKKAGNEIRRRYEFEIARLFHGELRMEVLKQRELLRRLDVVGLRFGEAADALSDAAVKRSDG
jgi:uncharacterized protein